ncbi:MAG: exodeoxyribonuclease III, partial [Microcystaceae cyanobacterium]
MKIATWNVNSVRSRQQHLVDWLTDNPVDVLCLQETKVIDQDFPRSPFTELGYHLAIAGQKSYNGVAIFSREPLQEIAIGFAPILGTEMTQDFDQQKRVISGVVNGIRVINLYVPNGSEVNSEKYRYKLAWLQLLKRYLSQLQQSNYPDFCVCGDFNIALKDIDIYDPKGKENYIGASPLERETLEDILSLGLQDAFRKFNQESGQFSWWDYRMGNFQRNRGWRIDHHYLTEKLYEKAKDCVIDREPRTWEKPSDHTPVIVELVM